MGYLESMSKQCGVPQGSILGPFLFLIFINDIDSKLKHCKVRLYADDIAIYTKENDIKMAHDRIQQDLDLCVTQMVHPKPAFNKRK